MNTTSAAACCAEFYEQDWVRALLGDHFHPGGEALTQRLFEDLHLSVGERVLDVACGTGTTGRLLVDGYDVEMVGLDYSAANVARARDLAGERDVTYVQGSADALPFDDQSFDAVVVECAVSTFADKPTVASEIARVLRPGGRLAISDMAVYQALPEDLAAFGRGWSCVDDALTLEGYRDLFTEAGLTAIHVEDESQSLLDMVLSLKKKLLLAGLGDASGWLAGMNTDLATLRSHLQRAKGLVLEGQVRYGRLLFAVDEMAPASPSARRAPACDPRSGCCEP